MQTYINVEGFSGSYERQCEHFSKCPAHSAFVALS